MRIGYIGSCLSGQVVKALLALDASNKLIDGLEHFRTDLLCAVGFENKDLLPSREILDEILIKLESSNELNRNRRRVLKQDVDSVRSFFCNVKNIDCLIFDNNFDLSTRLWNVHYRSNDYVLSNLEIKSFVDGFERLPVLHNDSLSAVYQVFFDFLKSLNKNLKIVFLQYPISGFLMHGTNDRVARSIGASTEIDKVSGIVNIPLVEIEKENLSEKGQHYFSDQTYALYAKLVTRLALGETFPTWLKSGTPMQKISDWLNGTKDADMPEKAMQPVTTGEGLLVLGSCLSARIAVELASLGFRVDGYLNYVRLDMFARYLADSHSFGAPKSFLDAALESYEGDSADPRYAKLKRRLKVQSWEYLEAFVAKIKTAGVLLVDNNYDLDRPVFKVMPEDGREYWLSNLSLKNVGVKYRNMGVMDMAGASAIYRSLFSQLRRLNPSLRIVFLQYPITQSVAGDDAAEARLARARGLARALDGVGDTVFPMIRMETENISEKNPNHFSDRVYNTLAQAVKKVLAGKSLPSGVTEEMEYSQLVQFFGDKSTLPKTNPYESLPDRQYWKLAVGDRYPLSIAGVYDRKFPIGKSDRISTFGSCFAQHIGHRLKARGFNFLDMEPAPASLTAAERAKHGYGIYSARYGNVYTSLQMLQLFQQAFGEIAFDEVWESAGRYYDPFRPNIFPDGFSSPAEMLAERQAHLQKVRTLFETSDLIVLTMGLTECWCNRESGAAYPVAPGVTVGQFDPARHVFRNLGYTEIHAHMLDLLARLAKVNPRARLLLTVSPVPLTATYEDRHVLVSTMHSKSVLRAVAGELAASRDEVDYFPSYEIIMSPPFRSMFFKSNLRNIHDDGVDFVMSHFFAQHSPAGEACASSDDEAGGDFCDEVFLELSKKMAD